MKIVDDLGKSDTTRVLYRAPYQKLGIVFALASTFLAASCSKNSPTQSPQGKTEIIPTSQAAPSENSDPALAPLENQVLQTLGEGMAQNPYLLKFNKNYWLGRKIWISVGVERSSVTGLAMSVFGYVPAVIERAGSNLILKKIPTGTFGGTSMAPEIPLNAYPILHEDFENILVDLGQPQNALAISSLGLFLEQDASTEFTPRLSFVNRAEITAEGINFDTLMTAKAPKKMFEPDEGTPEANSAQDPYLIGLKIRTDWLTVSENKNFLPIAASSRHVGLFFENPLVTNGGLGRVQYISRVDPSKPFNWLISSNTPKEFHETVKEGIVAWNKSIEAPKLEVKIADSAHAYTDPSYSNIVWDDNLAVGMAFANWRSNPFTGEIMQAQVYLSGNMWFEEGKAIHGVRALEKAIRAKYEKLLLKGKDKVEAKKDFDFSTLQLKINLATAKKELKKLARIQKNSGKRFVLGFNLEHAQELAKNDQHCYREGQSGAALRNEIGELEEMLDLIEKGETEELPFLETANNFIPQTDENEMPHNPYPPEGITAAELGHRVLRGVVMHEVGHTLSLRHNFAGSTSTSQGGRIQSASIMDYNDLVVDAQFDTPGDGDQWVLSQVYPIHEQGKYKPVPFCTDPDARKKIPNCSLHDFGKTTVDGNTTAVESSLLFAHFYFSVGSQTGINHLLRALRWQAGTLSTLLFSTYAGTSAFGLDFEEQQRKAWKLYRLTKTVYSMEFNPILKEAVSAAVFTGLVKSLNSDASDSILADEILAELSEGLLDPTESHSLEYRLTALKGLEAFQSFDARAKLLEGKDLIQSRLLVEHAYKTETEKAEDDEVLIHIRKIMEDGYFKPESEE